MRLELTYEELKHSRRKQNKNAGNRLRAYLWGIETKPRPKKLENRSLRLELTYEELKLSNRLLHFDLTIA